MINSLQSGHLTWVAGVGRGSWLRRLAPRRRKIPANSGLIRQASMNHPNPLRPRLEAIMPTTRANNNQKKMIVIMRRF